MRRLSRNIDILGPLGRFGVPFQVCDSFCKLWGVSGRGCVSTVVDLYASWRFLAILCRFLTGLLTDSAMCVALLVPEINARNGAKSHWKSLKIQPARVHKSSELRSRGVSWGSWEHSVS